jgi:hypothetical protein
MGSVEQTTTDVANLALAHCGVSKPIASIISEKSLEGQLCRTFMDISRQDVLREFPWFFARKQIVPALIANQPTPEWLYAYQYPSDALRISRFMSYRLTNDTRQSRVPYTVMQPVAVNLSTLTPPPTSYPQTSGMWLYTNWPGTNMLLPTIIEYIFDNQNVAQWPSDFIIALSYKLASFFVMTLTSGDPQKYKETIDAGYDASLSKSKSDNLNEEQRPEEPQSEFVRGREGGFASGVPGMQWVAEPSGFNVE